MPGKPITEIEAMPALEVDLLIDCDAWRTALCDVEDLCRHAIETAAEEIPGLAGQSCEVTVLLTHDARVRALNAQYRDKDSATNVLSFPALDEAERDVLRAGGGLPEGPLPGPVQIGDIAVAFETVDREARAEAKPLSDHLSHLVIHGFLHLLGYDHDSDDEAEMMEALERHVLVRLDISDPYSL